MFASTLITAASVRWKLQLNWDSRERATPFGGGRLNSEGEGWMEGRKEGERQESASPQGVCEKLDN